MVNDPGWPVNRIPLTREYGAPQLPICSLYRRLAMEPSRPIWRRFSPGGWATSTMSVTRHHPVAGSS
jgi:hypothetical protein